MLLLPPVAATGRGGEQEAPGWLEEGCHYQGRGGREQQEWAAAAGRHAAGSLRLVRGSSIEGCIESVDALVDDSSTRGRARSTTNGGSKPACIIARNQDRTETCVRYVGYCAIAIRRLQTSTTTRDDDGAAAAQQSGRHVNLQNRPNRIARGANN